MFFFFLFFPVCSRLDGWNRHRCRQFAGISIQIRQCAGHRWPIMGLFASWNDSTQEYSEILWQIVYKTMHCRHILRSITWPFGVLRKSNVSKNTNLFIFFLWILEFVLLFVLYVNICMCGDELITQRHLFIWFFESKDEKCAFWGAFACDSISFDRLRAIDSIFVYFNSPQGIAFRNIPLDKKLYAMVCSTSAKSSVRLINTTSFRDCLQFRCMKIITKYPQLLDVSSASNFMINLPNAID